MCLVENIEISFDHPWILKQTAQELWLPMQYGGREFWRYQYSILGKAIMKHLDITAIIRVG